MDRRAIACFDQALADTGLTVQLGPPRLLRLGDHDDMSAYDESPDIVPAGLPIPHRSWDGLSE